MQSLKEFSRFTKDRLSISDAYALRANLGALGIDDRLIAESAGAGIAQALRPAKGKILFVCGTGGKAAIGMSAARHMIGTTDVEVALANDGRSIRNGAAAFNRSLLDTLLKVQEIGEQNVGKLERMVRSCDVVVEALVGIGLKGRPSRFLGDAIKAVNAGKRIVSIDVPAGINADTGMPNTVSVRAHEIFSIHKRKKMLQGSKARSTVIGIGVPAAIELLAGPGDVMLATEPRSIRSNKYDNGAVLIVGGSAEYHGAPLLAAFAALRTGSGYVTLAVPKTAAISLKEESPNLVVRSMPGEIITRDDVPVISSIRHDSVVIGTGMSTRKDSLEAILEFMRHCEKPMVVDAAALRASALDKSVLNERMVLTPHEGEFEAMSGIKLDDATVEERIPVAMKFARTHRCILVLKGHETVITNGRQLKVNIASSPALSTMGSGDALSGMVASYLALHMNAFECAVAAVHAHAKIGDLLFMQKGLHITASDVVDAIPDVLRLFDVVKR